MNISRRPATIADTDFARAVHHRAYRDVIERQYGPWDESTQDKLVAAAWSATNHEIVLCDDARCGYTSIENRDDSFYLHELVIDPDFQGRGIGTHILRDIIEQAILKGLPVRLRTHILNGAVNLYRRMGFQETARTASHVLMEWNLKAMGSIPLRDNTENLFSYGTLQSEAVQLATFGRSLAGKPDSLIGYRVTLIPTGIPVGIPISNHNRMATTGGTHHRNIQFTGIASDVVEGSVFPVTKNELEQADAYERTADYKRVMVQLSSGKSAWVYLSTQPDTNQEGETP